MTQDTEKLAAKIACRLRQSGLHTDAKLADELERALRTPPTDTPDGELARAMLVNEDGLRELRLLFNHAENDSRQFTRWQMVTAINHGIRLSRPTPPVVAQPTAEQVERVAIALHRQANINVCPAGADVGEHPWEEASEQTKNWNRASALAAIRAMPLPKAGDKTTLPDDGLREALQIASSLVDTPIARRRLNLEGSDERLLAIRAALSSEGGLRELLEDARDSLKDMTDLVNSIGEDEDIGLPPPQWQRLEDATDTFNRIDAALSGKGVGRG